jgi:histidinol-phosphate phosphatase family protein
MRILRMIDIVIPTIGRASLARLLASIAATVGPLPEKIIVVDDRLDRALPLVTGPLDARLRGRVQIVPGRARGPAAARNTGWRLSRATWIAFVDDDVIVDRSWTADLAADLGALPLDVAASTGTVRVPLPPDRAATDWERNVAGLETAQWITADCAIRRSELLATGGFDERFPRAFREDSDIALRIIARGKRIAGGTRSVTHPVRDAPWWISVRLQAGNADDVLMRALHGADWHARAGAPAGAFAAHAATVLSALAAGAAFAARRPLLGRLALAVWIEETGRFAWRRIAPGPRTAREIAAMVATSIAIPFAAVAHRVRAAIVLPVLLADRERAPHPLAAAVLLDRDGTLIVDVPHNADPGRVVAMPHAFAALERLRDAGIPTAVVSNQSGVALGMLKREDVSAVNAQMEALLGPLGPVFVCEHAAAERCTCRKPAPGMIEAAARALGVAPRDCVMIGDIGADIEAARAAGARAILVATAVTRREEIVAAPHVAANLGEAVSAVLNGAA